MEKDCPLSNIQPTEFFDADNIIGIGIESAIIVSEKDIKIRVNDFIINGVDLFESGWLILFDPYFTFNLFQNFNNETTILGYPKGPAIMFEQDTAYEISFNKCNCYEQDNTTELDPGFVKDYFFFSKNDGLLLNNKDNNFVVLEHFNGEKFVEIFEFYDYNQGVMAFSDRMHGVVILGEFNLSNNLKIFRTSDGGTSWNAEDLNNLTEILDLRYLQNNQLLNSERLVYDKPVNNPRYYEISLDDGVSWESYDVPSGKNLAQIFNRESIVLSESGSYFIYDPVVSLYIDTIENPLSNGMLSFYSETTAIAYNKDYLFYTNNGGNDWQVLIDPCE